MCHREFFRYGIANILVCGLVYVKYIQCIVFADTYWMFWICYCGLKYIDCIMYTLTHTYRVYETRILATSVIAFLYSKSFVDFNNEKVVYTNSLFQIAVICKMEIFSAILYVYLYTVISLESEMKTWTADLYRRSVTFSGYKWY